MLANSTIEIWRYPIHRNSAGGHFQTPDNNYLLGELVFFTIREYV